MGAPQTLPANFDGFDKAPDTLPADFNKWDQAKKTEQGGFLDRKIPLDSYTNATLSGVQSIGRGLRDAAKGTYDTIAQPPKDATESTVNAFGPGALPLYRMLRGAGHTAMDATQVVGAIHDINKSNDPLGAYAQAAQETAGQGAGQAILALGTEGVVRAVPAVGGTVAPAVRATARAANKVLEKAPGTIGGATGASVGGYIGGHLGAEIGGAAGYALGKEILPQVRIPGEGFGFPNRVAGGPAVAPAYQPGAAGTIAQSVSKPSITPAAVEQQLKQALRAQDLKPGVSLRDQLNGANAQPAPKLPEGFSPVDSSALKGFKYDPQSREFESITQGGQRYVHGDVSPEDAKAFMDADSKGKAWQQIRENPLVAKVINGKRVAIKPTSSAEAAPTDDLMPKLQESLKQARAAKANADLKYVYRARDVGESGVPVNNDLAQATSDPIQAMRYAEAGQRGTAAGEVVKIDLTKLKPSDYVIKTHPSGAKWIQFTRPLAEDEVSAFAGKVAGKK